MDEVLEKLDWKAWLPIEKAATGEDGDMLLSGPVASTQRDFDGDLLD